MSNALYAKVTGDANETLRLSTSPRKVDTHVVTNGHNIWLSVNVILFLYIESWKSTARAPYAVIYNELSENGLDSSVRPYGFQVKSLNLNDLSQGLNRIGLSSAAYLRESRVLKDFVLATGFEGHMRGKPHRVLR